MYNPEKPYENRDPRFYDCVYYNGSTTKDDRIVETFQGGADMLNQDMTMTSYYLRKFVNEKEPISQSHHYTTPFPFFRLAEIYLNYAEAEYHLGNEDIAREYVNKVRARKSVNMPPITESGDALLKRIYHERQIELAFEGDRFWTLARRLLYEKEENRKIYRMNVLADDQGQGFAFEGFYERKLLQTRYWDNKMYLYPIAQTEIDRGRGLVQNPGW